MPGATAFVTGGVSFVYVEDHEGFGNAAERRLSPAVFFYAPFTLATITSAMFLGTSS